MKQVEVNERVYIQQHNVISCLTKEDTLRDLDPPVFPLFTIRLPTSEEADMLMEDLKKGEEK